MKDKYEISLWEDYQGENDTYYSERKIAVIGSNDMTSPCRAYNPKLVQNVNGTNTFTFDMYMTYKENFVKDGEDKTFTNPFLALLVNERKIKVLWKEKWYDFIIKQCAEDSTSKKITYTCKDLYVNELSKNGYDLEFDSELNNNYGTAQELVEATLKGIEWKLKENTENILQKKEEPVYELTLTSDLDAINQTKGEATTIKAGQTILVFYEQLAGETILNKTYQFAYAPLSNYKKDTNSRLVVNADCYSADFNGVELTDKSVSENYRAERLVETKKQVYDPITKKYCYVLKAIKDADVKQITVVSENGNERTFDLKDYSVNDEIYEFVETEYNDALVVKNLINNDTEFTNTNGWEATKNGESTAVHIGLSYDKNSETAEKYFGSTFLEIAPDIIYENDGLITNSVAIPDEGFVEGKYYIFRYTGRLQWNQGANKDPISAGEIKTPELSLLIEGTPTIEKRSNGVGISGSISSAIGGIYSIKRQIIFNSKTVGADDQGWDETTGYYWMRLQCQRSISKKDIQRQQLRIKIENINNNKYIRWIKSIQFFPEVKTENGSFICPYDIDTSTVVSTIHRYYNHTAATAAGISSLDDIDYLWSGTGTWDNKNLKYEQNNFVKKRSISVSKSNRFNILQTIAEQFECWINFEIEHNQETGEITRNPDGSPCKYVSVRQNVGKDLGFGFIYGIDLKSISRNIQSDQIVSKTLVLPNNNECAPGGFCAISSSKENYPGIDFILNFDYYISQGLLSPSTVNKDLYDSENGYYTQLHKETTDYKERATKVTDLKMRLTKAENNLKVFENLVSAANTAINGLKEELRNLSPKRKSYESAVTQQWIADNMDDDGVAARVISLQTQEGLKTRYENNVEFLTEQIVSITSDLKTAEEAQTASLEKINELHKKFFNKYSHYIQEGTWTSEDYIDSNLYYLDAQSVAYTSSRPQVSYNISVLRLSSLEDFKNKIFNVGDISYIQDTEFFGYEADRKTPYKEQVIISEVSSFFEEPDKDFFTVQNYKTQFEDLFQRITSTTQSLQYASGSYARAAGIVESDGTIKGETLQDSIKNNGDLVFGATDESVIWNNTGITVSDKSNSLKKTRLTSGGLFISVDGGATWKNAVRGEGISTQYLTAGTINVGEIIIMDKNYPSFKWDSNGISAFEKQFDTNNNFIGYDQNSYVRFDSFGIYGIQDNLNFTPVKEADIYDNAKFGMTWSRFFMKNKSGNGSVEISTDEDFQVKAGENERIKIGRLSSYNVQIDKTDPSKGTKTEYIYGIRISDANGNSVLVTGDDGNLWLKNQLLIGGSGDAMVSLGYLNGTKEVNETITSEDGSTQITKKIYHEVLNANDYFIVYENGDVIANNGVFNGEINAKSGSFGNNAVKITDTGLVVKEGGLIIQGSGDKTLLSFKDGDLLISGIINAQAGGTIGGFTIKEDQLISQNHDIVLNGEEGTIIADNITLGEGAKIDSFIQLGENVKLFGSDSNKVLETYASDKKTVVTSLTQDGTLYLGENIRFVPSENKGYFGKLNEKNTIIIDGKNSIIGGKGWSITPTMATFSNIDLGTGTIHAARFEINQTQLVGGSMIFKQAYSGTFSKSSENGVIIGKFTFSDEQKEELKNINTSIGKGDAGAPISFINHWVIFTSHNRLLLNGNCYKVSDYDNGVLSFNPCPFPTNLTEFPDGIIDLGEIDTENTSWTIAINSETGSLGSFGGGRGLTITEFLNDGNDLITNTPRLFMGDLSGLKSIGIQGYTGVGLYCDNVYLKGEMATAGKKAGISTNNSIVLWAGAKDASSISTAKFRVLDDGSVHAEKGFFTDSTIKGGKIYATHIYGWKKNETEDESQDESAALSIHDTAKGIIFLKDIVTQDENGEKTVQEEETFGIKDDGIYTSDSKNYIIKLSTKDKKVSLYGDNIYTNRNSGSNRLHLINNYIYGCGENEAHTAFALFDGKTVKLGVKNSEGNSEQTRFQVSSDATTIYETLTLEGQSSQGKLSFTYKAHKTSEEVDGYDLYIN